LYARVSSHDQKADLGRQIARLTAWAEQVGLPVVRVEAEVGSGMNGARAKARRLVTDPAATVVVVEHRDRLGRMNTELAEAALSAHGRRLAVLDEGEVTDDLVRDVIEVLTLFCARLYGRRSARNRALKAVGAHSGTLGRRPPPRWPWRAPRRVGVAGDGTALDRRAGGGRGPGGGAGAGQAAGIRAG
jgi:putative resolvase